MVYGNDVVRNVTAMNSKIAKAEHALWMIGFGKPIEADTPEALMKVRREARRALNEIDGKRRVDERLVAGWHSDMRHAIAHEELEYYCPICKRQIQTGDHHDHNLGDPIV